MNKTDKNILLVVSFLILAPLIYFSFGYLFEFDKSFIESSRLKEEYTTHLKFILILAPLALNGILLRLPYRRIGRKNGYTILWTAWYSSMFLIAFSLYYNNNIAREFNYYWFLIYISYLPSSILGITNLLSDIVDSILTKLQNYLIASIHKNVYGQPQMIPDTSQNNLVVVEGKMGSGISFYLSKIVEGKKYKVYNKLYSNDNNRINELKNLANYNEEERLNIILDCPYVEGLNDIIKDLLKNEKITVLVGTYYPSSLFDGVSNTSKYFTVNKYKLKDIDTDNETYILFEKNEIWEMMN